MAWAACGIAAFPALAGAAIITGETVTASSSIGFPFVRGVNLAVDDSGLGGGDGSLATADQSHSNVPDNNMWLSSGDAFGGTDFNPTVTVDLNGVYNVHGIRIWNYNEHSNNPAAFTMRGVRDTNILISLDDIIYTPVGTFAIPIADGSPTYAGTYFDVLAATAGAGLTFRYMQFDILSNHGGDNNFYGLSEIAFEGNLVPEPATFTLAGAAAALLAGRRRRRPAR